MTSGRTLASPEQAIGSQPVGLAVDPSTATVYAMHSLQPAGSMPIFGT